MNSNYVKQKDEEIYKKYCAEVDQSAVQAENKIRQIKQEMPTESKGEDCMYLGYSSIAMGGFYGIAGLISGAAFAALPIVGAFVGIGSLLVGIGNARIDKEDKIIDEKNRQIDRIAAAQEQYEKERYDQYVSDYHKIEQDYSASLSKKSDYYAGRESMQSVKKWAVSLADSALNMKDRSKWVKDISIIFKLQVNTESVGFLHGTSGTFNFYTERYESLPSFDDTVAFQLVLIRLIEKEYFNKTDKTGQKIRFDLLDINDNVATFMLVAKNPNYVPCQKF